MGPFGPIKFKYLPFGNNGTIMIITTTIAVRDTRRNRSYYVDRGYKSYNKQFVVNVKDLPPHSIHLLECKCDVCGKYFKRKYENLHGKEIHRCFICEQRNRAYTRNDAPRRAAVSKYRKSITGELHAMFNPNKEGLKGYTREVRRLTEINYKKYAEKINPHKYRRTLMGIAGGYQLDHIISIKFGYDNHINPNIIADVTNLQVIPWEINRKKSHRG